MGGDGMGKENVTVSNLGTELEREKKYSILVCIWYMLVL